MFTINKRHLAIADMCLPKNGGSSIESVFVSHANSVTTIVATDGYALIKVETDNRAEDYPEIGVPKSAKDSALISASDWKDILKALPKRVRLPIIQNVLVSPQEENKIAVGHTDLEKTSTTVILSEDKQYPEYEYVLEHKGEYVIRFNPKLLAKTLETIAAMDADYVDLCLPENPVMAMKVQTETPHGDKIEAAIMPMRRV